VTPGAVASSVTTITTSQLTLTNNASVATTAPWKSLLPRGRQLRGLQRHWALPVCPINRAEKRTSSTCWIAGTNTSAVETRSATATQVSITNDTLKFELADGGSISAPLAWYPRLVHGAVEERSRWRLIGQWQGGHWPELDEDISVENLLAGRPSAESQGSLTRRPGIFR
jgi:Protein of unknown function (DUF2442)